jgi:hypothetical protein
MFCSLKSDLGNTQPKSWKIQMSHTDANLEICRGRRFCLQGPNNGLYRYSRVKRAIRSLLPRYDRRQVGQLIRARRLVCPFGIEVARIQRHVHAKSVHVLVETLKLIEQVLGHVEARTWTRLER